MNERLPYEANFHQQLNDILLPDENMAWEDMKRRLQEEDDDTTIVAWWRRGCMLWGILIGALFIVGLYWHYSSKNLKENSDQNNTKTNILISKEKDTVSKYIIDTLNSTKADSGLLISQKTKNVHNDFLPVEEKRLPQKYQEKQSQKPVDKKNSKKIIIRSKNKTKTTVHNSQSEIDKPPDSIIKNEAVTTLTVTTLNKDDSLSLKMDSAFVASKNAEIIKESIKDSLIKKIASEKLLKEDSSRQNKISFGAGLALHQQVPVNGQTLTPYNSLGRKGTLRDYIPSVYLRLNKNNKWFLQAEFRYGAPQNNKVILFDQQIDSIPFSSKIQTTSNNVKKTYYHQLPLTFNYFITHNWSVGAGVVWNKFYSAVTEQNAVQHDFISGADSIITQGVISRQTKADSNFSKSFFQGLIETQYKWKRFSFGVSYAQGLQPYIKFRLPGEAEKKERNSSLQFFIRYEIWNSKK